MAAEPTTLTCCSRGHHDNCTLGEDCGCAVCNVIDEAPPASVDTAGVIWEDPPSNWGRGPRLGLTDEQRTALTSNPKRRARIRDYPNSKGSANTAAQKLRKNEPGFEFTARATGNTSTVYARYVG